MSVCQGDEPDWGPNMYRLIVPLLPRFSKSGCNPGPNDKTRVLVPLHIVRHLGVAEGLWRVSGAPCPEVGLDCMG